MPNPSFYVRGALAAEFDARQWAGAALYTRDSGALVVTGPSNWGVFSDVLDVLTGRGSGNDPGSEFFNLAGTAEDATGTPVTVTINASDRVQMLFTGAASVTLAAGAGNALWGFSAAGQVSASDGLGNQVLTAVDTWTRGNVALTSLALTRGASSGNAPDLAGITAHGLLDSLRTWGSADADDLNPAGNLCALEYAGGVGTAYTRWGINADGHVFTSRKTVEVSDVTWVSTTFRDALGFTGLETGTVAGAYTTTVATYPCPGLLTPSRVFDSVWRGLNWHGSAVLASNAGAYTTTWLDRYTYAVSFFLDGPADRIDRQNHMLHQVLPHMPPGGRVTLYQDWGDYRRSVRTEDTSNPAVAPRVAPYSLLYTSQADGTYGRLLCRRDPGETGSMVAAWPDRVLRRLPMTMLMAEWEGGQ